MSLQLLAKQMEAKGRKGDSVLVHMTPSEVAALQEMAESAGGSLSVNPETGLVEAFSLRNLLPAIVGGALVASGVGMPLAIAGGALTGGVQAKRDDKDFLTGALMGGLSAYGGAGLAGGLGAAGNVAASQAASAANPAFMGPMPGAATGFEAAKAGLAGLGKQAGREAFMQGVGGMGGLAKAAGAVAGPMLTEEQKMAEAPVDDEMYSYTFDPGRTYAERDPSATSAEREYFRSRYSPMRRIRASEYPVYAAQGGLMSLAEGGETAADTAAPALGMPGGIGEPTAQVVVYGPDGTMYPNPAAARAAGVTNYTMQQPVTEANEIIPRMPDSGATNTAPSSSEAALAYLMGERSSSAPARSPFIDAQLMGASPKSNIGVGADNMYAFDPATGTFLRNPNVAGATSDAVRSPVGTSFADSGGSYEPLGPNPDFDTPEKQAAYYAENPTMGAITRAGQTALSYTPMSLFASAVAPEYMDRRAQEADAITRGTAIGIGAPISQSVFQGTPLSDSSFGDGFGGYASDNSPDGAYGYSSSGDSSMRDQTTADTYGTDYGSEQTSMLSAQEAGFFAKGGIASLAKGGMASGGFVFPADALSALGNGSTDAGLRKLNAMMGGGVTLIKGKGDGLSDSIPTNIDGKQPARVADGEAYIEPAKVKEKGGAKVLYAMMDKVRAQAHGKTTQQRKVNPGRVMA